MGNGRSSTFWVWWGLLAALCVWGMLVLLVFSLTLTGFGYGGVFFAGHAFLAEVGGYISFVTIGEFLGLLKKVLQCFDVEAEISGI